MPNASSIPPDTPLAPGPARVHQLFRFLQAFNQRRNPLVRLIDDQPWRLRLGDLPDHPDVELLKLQGEDVPSQGERVLLRVKRPEAPAPPPEVAERLRASWRDLSVDIEIDSEGFDKEPRLQALLDKWLGQRQAAWSALLVWNKMFDLHDRLKREPSLEAIVGDGVLSWVGEAMAIRHPVLLLRVTLEFDALKPEFTVVEADRPVELYSAALREAGFEGQSISKFQQEMEQESVHPLGAAQTEAFLKRLIHTINGTYADPPRHQPTQLTGASVIREPVLFLRRRNLGFATAIESILSAIAAGGDIPPALLAVAGADVTGAPGDALDTHASVSSDVEQEVDVLFTKPANSQQLEIVRTLARHGRVLVQGPPGTGKTHTIGNLIGHLLAEGKTVLVTSQGPRALEVLTEQVVEPLRPLCFTMLDADTRVGRERLQASVESILSRLDTASVRDLEIRARRLREERNRLLSQLQNARMRLRQAREVEETEAAAVVVGGRGYEIVDAAKRVAAGSGVHDWIPAPVEASAALALSDTEVEELYRTNLEMRPEDEADLIVELPNQDSLPSPTRFEALVTERKRLLPVAVTAEGCKLLDGTVEEIEELISRVLKALQALGAIRPGDRWRLVAVAAGIEGGQRLADWKRFLRLVREADKLGEDARRVQGLRPHLAPEVQFPLEVQIRILEEITAGGGRVGLLAAKEWKAVAAASLIGPTRPTQPEHFRALLAVAKAKRAERQLSDAWRLLVVGNGGPALSNAEPGRDGASYLPALTADVEWYATYWSPLDKAIKALGVDWDTIQSQLLPHPRSDDALRRLRAAVDILLKRLEGEAARKRLQQLDEELKRLHEQIVAQIAKHTPVCMELLEAWDAFDAERYRVATERLRRLRELQPRWNARLDLLKRLGGVAHRWAEAIRSREPTHDGGTPPGVATVAWLWRQFRDELDRRHNVSLAAVQEEILRIRNATEEVTASLVEALAWLAQCRRVRESDKRTLRLWRQTIDRARGRRAPRLQKEARRLLEQCRSAAPVWVMPLSQVADAFDCGRTRFDVVIMDEASQADPLGLIALYLGREAVIVGDDEQVTPLDVGSKIADAEALIEEFLKGLPGALLYTGQFSTYHIAELFFPRHVRLLEHFRSVRDIIAFSNDLCYRATGSLQPLRDESRVSTRPFVVSYRVADGIRQGHSNDREARAVAALLVAAAEQAEYRDATFGVISMLSSGDAQTGLIELELRRRLSPEDYERRNVTCGNPSDFQGAQRDVVFLSLVDSPPDEGGQLRRDRTTDLWKQRFNVAASRARDQMWVVHSLDPHLHLAPGDLRRTLIKHAEDPRALTRYLEEAEQRVESEFERLVLHDLVGRGYRTASQYPVGRRRIDLVVEGGGRRLAVECDGDRCHTRERLAEDMARQATLERLGWRFHRIRASRFFSGQAAAMEELYERLSREGIPPEGAPRGASPEEGHELKQRVIRRAEELRRAWEAEEGPRDGALTPRGRRGARSGRPRSAQVGDPEEGNGG